MTTTVPVEIIYAAGKIPVDLNNIFITHANSELLLERAEIQGFPRTVCGWIKGLYSTAHEMEDLGAVITVTQGDCSNTHALMETWQAEGIKTIPFAYPFDGDNALLEMQIKKMAQALGADWKDVLIWKQKLDAVRALIWEIDRRTWQDNTVNGFDNHLWQVSCSDFNGDPQKFASLAEEFILELNDKKPYTEEIRLGFIGVPPIFTDLYEYIEEQKARVVFNEVQRQFTLPFPGADIIEAYGLYTYPYSLFKRLDDIKKEIATRNIHAVIHYTQSFCFRQIEDIIIRKEIGVPLLTIEGDRPGNLDARTKMRIDAFLDLVR